MCVIFCCLKLLKNQFEYQYVKDDSKGMMLYKRIIYNIFVLRLCIFYFKVQLIIYVFCLNICLK